MMVDVTYQMILSTFQTAGLLVGISYYILTLRNQQKNQKHAEETRKIQLLHSINEERLGGENLSRWYDMIDMEWDDYQDFMSKYSHDKNLELYKHRMTMWQNMNQNGLLVRDGLIDARSYVQYVGDLPPVIWGKFKDIIEEQRILFDNPDYFVGIEVLANEISKYRSSLGLKPKVLLDVR